MKYEMFDLLGAFNREGTFLGDPKQSPKGKFRAYFFSKKRKPKGGLNETLCRTIWAARAP